MLFRLELENFSSFRHSQVMELRIARNAPDLEKRFASIYLGSPDRVPKIVALFGANGSGKSTVLRALWFVSWFVSESFGLPAVSDQPAPGLGFQPCQRFLSDETLAVPTRICVHFTGALNFWEPREQWNEFCRYAYEVRFENSSGRPRNVIYEGLRQWPKGRGKAVRIFERNAEGRVFANKVFGLSGYQNVIDKVRSNVSLISTLVQFDHKPSLLIREVARTVIANIASERIDLPDEVAVRSFYTQQPMVDALNRDIERIDLGIVAMRIVNGNQGPLAQFEHDGLSALLPIGMESHGTRQFVRIYPIIASALETGGVAIIDELDTSIHPLILPEIIRWFYDPERNKHGAQLWMTCQAASLLEELQKEEVFFCEKDRQGKSQVYGLTDIQAVRRSDNLYKKYLGGVYGAVPHLG
jgi:hypothetical protein